MKTPPRHDTPVDSPAVDDDEGEMLPSKQLIEQREGWVISAAQYKADGYTAAVIARKMIQVHGMPEAEAEAHVGELFGKRVNARAGDTASGITVGLVMIAAGLGGASLLYLVLGLAFLKATVLIYGALLALAGAGLTRVIITAVNSGTKPDLK